MNIEDFRTYLEENYEAFAKWGDYVMRKINKALEISVGSEEFIKIPPSPRVKKIESALGKVGRKGYTNPIGQMTDLVGVRYVVLLSDQINLISEIVESSSDWTIQVSKDYQEEIQQKPKFFDYQSKHFEVRPKADFELNKILITKNICCEVQIRTLLQHAYAELVHDSIYKPVGPVPHQAERQVARSMALMETTDELFCSTMKLLTDTNKPRNQLLEELMALYREKIGGHLLRIDNKTNYAVLDTFRDVIRDGLSADIGSFIDRKKYIPRNIIARASKNSFFAQPIILFVYWLGCEADPDELYREWPLPGYLSELNLVFSDLDRKPSYYQ